MVKTSIIPIFIPHIGCSYRCVFCNQWRITGRRGVPDGNAVARTIKEYVTSAAEKRHWEVAFYGGSFTAIPMVLQEELLARLMKPCSRPYTGDSLFDAARLH